MGALDTALGTLFNSELGTDATYTPKNGTGIPVRVVMLVPDVVSDLAKQVKIQQQAVTIEVRASDVASPAAGDSVTVGLVQYRVTNTTKKDPRGAVWTLEASTTA